MTPLIALSAAWSAGIVLARAALVPPAFWLLPLPFALALWWLREHPAARWTLWLLAGLMLGAGRYLLSRPVLDAQHIAVYADGGTTTLIGVVTAEPIPHRRTTSLRVEAEQLTLADGTTVPVHGAVLIQAPPRTTAFFGDRVEVQGTLARPPVGETFSYRDYLARQGVYAMMGEGSTVVILERHQRSRALEAMLRFRLWAVERLRATLPEPHASLLSGILLGVEWHIPADLDDAFAATGTSHIIAISGFNMTIVAALFAVLARALVGRRYESWIALGGLWLYTLLVGAAAAVVRAAVMGSLLIIARRGHRRIHGPTTLAAAAWLMSLHNPLILWDVGFQLSLAATAGILLLQPPISAWIAARLRRLTTAERSERWMQLLEESFIVTLAAQITTTPILVATFHRLSPISLLTNFLILPVQPYVMLFGGIALGGALLWLPLGRVLSLPVWGLLDYTIRVVRALGRLPWASIEVGQVALEAVWGYYAVLLGIIGWRGLSPSERGRLWRRLRDRPAWQWALAGAFLLALLTLPSALPDGRLHLWSLPVPGNALLIRSPRGRFVLIDGSGDADRLAEAIDAHLPWYSRHLAMVILTAPQPEELPGLEAVLERYRIDAVILPPATGSEAATFRSEVEGRASTWRIAAQGDRWQVDAVRFEVLWPPEGRVGPLILRLDYGSTAILLPMHATPPLERRLAALGAPLRCDLLIAPRHGAPSSLTPEFLRAASPQIILFDEAPAPQPLLRARETAVVYVGDAAEGIAFVDDGQRLWTRASPAEE